MSEEAAMLMKNSTGLKVKAEVGRCIEKTMDWGYEKKRNIREDRTLSAHSEAIP